MENGQPPVFGYSAKENKQKRKAAKNDTGMNLQPRNRSGNSILFKCPVWEGVRKEKVELYNIKPPTITIC